MSEYKKHFWFEIVKAIATAIVGGIVFWSGQQWLIDDLEYKKVSKNSYLSAPLGQQGLTMAYNDKPLKNISVIEFGIFNRTQKQFHEFDLVFSIDDTKIASTLVSSGIIAPSGIPQSEAVHEIETNNSSVKKYRIKIFPKDQKKSAYYHAVFVFDGDKLPEMSVVSLSKDVSIKEYSEFREIILGLVVLFSGVLLTLGIMIMFMSGIDFYLAPNRHKKYVDNFMNHIKEMQNKGELKSIDANVLTDMKKIYAYYKRPQSNSFWSKIFGERKYEYCDVEEKI